ncbi:MAG: extracellular solute-binding protein [Clostridium sp.]|nr:extracellular solute-binding protein [Acetatifactor muris]MCM1526813.1 extracellular solute-binding protein [Bacteroides sp.]MCM1562986.1 extracellular solute-binding protein [Clostridium sp.]
MNNWSTYIGRFGRYSAAVVCAGLLCTGLSGCSKSQEGPLNPDDPVSLTVWHYYHGAQQNAFDSLVTEFNATVGREKGIYVQGISQGTVSDLENAVKDSLAHKVGSAEMPDIFSSYADTAYEVEQAGALANLSDYMNDEELSVYVDSYVEEGRIAADNSLRIFPVAKSTETMILNKTGWDEFAGATGASLEDLKSLEGVVATAQAYYEWTDALTPDVPNDGKSFYGRDSMANYFCIGMMQLGNEIFQVEDGEVTLNLDKPSIRRLWDCYYVPMVKGYFGAYGSFRSDDVKTGDLLAYTGATTSAMYFPDAVELESGRYEIDYLVMAAPIFEGGADYAVQQGAGMVVSKSDERHEYAAIEFLKWFTEAENNLAFCGDSGYLPVMKSANDREVLDKVMEEQGMEMSAKTYDCITQVFDEMSYMTFYTNKCFRTGSAARKVLEYDLADKAQADRAAVVEAIDGGASPEEACAEFLTDEAFEQWYQSFCGKLEDVVK